jgi:hypothetical protein
MPSSLGVYHGAHKNDQEGSLGAVLVERSCEVPTSSGRASGCVVCACVRRSVLDMPPSSSSYKPASVLTMLLGPLGLLWYMALQQSLWITTHVEDGRRHGLLPPLQSPSTARDLPEIVWLASFPNSGTCVGGVLAVCS